MQSSSLHSLDSISNIFPKKNRNHSPRNENAYDSRPITASPAQNLYMFKVHELVFIPSPMKNHLKTGGKQSTTFVKKPGVSINFAKITELFGLITKNTPDTK